MRLAVKKTLWRTRPVVSVERNVLAKSQANGVDAKGKFWTNPDPSNSSWPMIFASIFGSFVAIAVLQRMWPRKVHVIHKNSEGEQVHPYEGWHRPV